MFFWLYWTLNPIDILSVFKRAMNPSVELVLHFLDLHEFCQSETLETIKFGDFELGWASSKRAFYLPYVQTWHIL